MKITRADGQYRKVPYVDNALEQAIKDAFEQDTGIDIDSIEWPKIIVGEDMRKVMGDEKV
jgi:hypothetical protein